MKVIVNPKNNPLLEKYLTMGARMDLLDGIEIPDADWGRLQRDFQRTHPSGSPQEAEAWIAISYACRGKVSAEARKILGNEAMADLQRFADSQDALARGVKVLTEKHRELVERQDRHFEALEHGASARETLLSQMASEIPAGIRQTRSALSGSLESLQGSTEQRFRELRSDLESVFIRSRISLWEHRFLWAFRVLLLLGLLWLCSRPAHAQVVTGNKSNNTAVPGATNLGALPCLVNNLSPIRTEGYLVFLSCDLLGNVRVSVTTSSLATLTDAIVRLDADLKSLRLYGTLGQPLESVGGALRVSPVTPLDPCATPQKGNTAISQTASTKLVTGQPGRRIFLCSARVVAGAAEILSYLEWSGSACGTGTAAVTGSTTAANGESYAANGGFAQGGNGSSIAVTNTPGNDLCLGQSTSNRLAGNITFAYGP